MKRWALIFVLFSAKAMALEAVVTVLETPMFKNKSYDAPVVQYLRKGDVIKVHPSIANRREFDEYAPPANKRKALWNELKKTSEYNEDPLFKGSEKNTAYIEDEFIPTLDRQGNTVYVLSSHIFVYFNDEREFEQTITAKDPTDYRLEEPLPKNYPLKTRSGLRGQFLLGITQPYFESYEYLDSTRTKGYSSPFDMSYTMLKQAPGNYNKRLFIGGTLNFRYFENSFTFYDRRISEEKGIKLGLGPTISYDAFKGDKNRINLSGSIIVNVFDRFYISQSLDSQQEDREYVGYSVAPRFSIQYHRKGIAEDVDFVLGTALEVGTATTYRAKNAGRNTSWWQDIANDSFTTRTTFMLGGYVGVQTAY